MHVSFIHHKSVTTCCVISVGLKDQTGPDFVFYHIELHPLFLFSLHYLEIMITVIDLISLLFKYLNLFDPHNDSIKWG